MSPASCARKWIVLSGLLLTTPAAVFAGASFAPSGGEFAVSGQLPGDQTASHLAISPAGGWVVWSDGSIDGSGLGIAARKLDANLNPAGAPLHVNKTTKGDQERPNVSLLNGGGAVVVWQGGNFGFQNVYARFLDANGSPLNSSDILVNRPEGSSSTRITTNLVMIRNNKPKLKLQRLKESWKTHLERTGGAVAATLSDGTVIVAYASHRKASWTVQEVTERVRKIGKRWVTNSVLVSVPYSSDSMQDIYFQRFTATGEKIGDEVIANQFRPFNQHSPAIAARADGTFVLAWTSDQQRTGLGGDSAIGQMNVRGEIEGRGLRGQSDIVARLFSNDGTPVANEFVVNTDDLPCSSASVAASAGGGFTVAWAQKDTARERNLDIFSRAFSPAGNPVTEGFVVNEYTFGDQHSPKIAAAPAGQLLVWTSLKQDGSFDGVFGRWLNDGDIQGGEFRVNTTTYLRQFQPAVAADSGNRAMVIWSSYQTEAAFDLFGQRYSAQ